jgi:hypothetical protein
MSFCMFSFGLFSSVWRLAVNVSKHVVWSIFRRVRTSYPLAYEDGLSPRELRDGVEGQEEWWTRCYILKAWRLVHTGNVTAAPISRNFASDWHDTELRSELSSRASCRNSTLRAVTPWGSQFVTGARSIMNVKKVRGADSGDVSRCTSRPAQAVTVSSLWCDGQIPTAHLTCP